MTRFPLVVLALAGLSVAPPAVAQTKIDFGNDSSQWANDGECDDPRFIGEGMAVVYSAENTSRDASDCRAAFQAGTIRLREPVAAGGNLVVDGVEFGDDTGQWANDGQCDDPRFVGAGHSGVNSSEHNRADATDCAAAFRAGTIQERPQIPAGGLVIGGINFGDDSGVWANDGECDDPRFIGEGHSGVTSSEHDRADATDCAVAFQAGRVRLVDAGGSPAKAPAMPGGGATEIDFGDDSGPFGNDGECDDPRFIGEGMANYAGSDGIRGDASDCRALFERALIRLREPVPEGEQIVLDGINFGDDSGDWANDVECDDPRFQGEGMAETLLDADLHRDATDCAEAYRLGRVTLRAGADRR